MCCAESGDRAVLCEKCRINGSAVGETPGESRADESPAVAAAGAQTPQVSPSENSSINRINPQQARLINPWLLSTMQRALRIGITVNTRFKPLEREQSPSIPAVSAHQETQLEWQEMHRVRDFNGGI